jgi:hypothetical protein
VKTGSLAVVLGAVCTLLATSCGGSTHQARSDQPSVLVTIKVLKHGRQVLALVPVRIDGHGPYEFALDTGASTSLVDSQVAKELDVRRTGSKERIAGVASVSKVATIRVRKWSVGGVALPATSVVEANLPFGNASGGVQGLLGSDMLSQFDVVTIDYGHSRLVLHHRARS